MYIRKQYFNKKIRANGRIYAVVILIMFGIVMYDSFRNDLPFHYILYAIAGILTGRIYYYTREILFDENTSRITYRSNPAGIIIGIVLLVLRFYAGNIILEAFNVMWITDAVYLFFIGVYLSKLKTMIKQIDDKLFAYLYEREKNRG